MASAATGRSDRDRAEKIDEGTGGAGGSSTSEVVAFTARLDVELMERLDAERADLERELGFAVSRADMLARIVKMYFTRTKKRG